MGDKGEALEGRTRCAGQRGSQGPASAEAECGHEPRGRPPTSRGAAAPMVGDAGEGRGGEGPG